MRATMEKLEVVEHHPARHHEAVVQQVREHKKNSPAVARKRHVERWSSSLDPQDLQCLLALLEGHVLPQLISAYAPSTAAPVERLAKRTT